MSLRTEGFDNSGQAFEADLNAIIDIEEEITEEEEDNEEN